MNQERSWKTQYFQNKINKEASKMNRKSKQIWGKKWQLVALSSLKERSMF